MELDYSNEWAKAKVEMSGGGDRITLRTSEGDIRINKLTR